MLPRLVVLKLDILAVLNKTDFTKRQRRAINLDENNWVLAKDLVRVLQSFEKATSMLGGQTYATLSLVLPILDGLAKGLSVGADDSASCTAVKNQLRAELVAKFNLEAVQTTSLCGAVDPHFRHSPFLQSEDDRERAKKNVLEELQRAHQQLQHQQKKSQEMWKQSAL